mmetsp:Transcript_8968/g.22969  ORF Transcript_8968/g.22969 Transcript_8968/m.22969 type:complete len:295 (-) Transcript_8968:128-1012(-)
MSEHELDICRISMEEKIGSGVTASVYRGIMDGSIEVAVKEIDWNKTKMNDSQQVAFDREVAIMAKVRHPNLVNFMGVVSVDMPFRIVTEFCGGGCCFELLHNDDDVVLEWAQQHKMCLDVAQAVEYLHSFNPKIIHRDLKSLNLLLARPVKSGKDMPWVKVSDFGLSRMQESVGEWGKMTVAAGTCHWMAPEVFTQSNYDERVDVYSYAMIMFEIICREIPFEDEEPANVGRLISKGQRPDLEAVPPDCPPEILQMKDLMIRGWAQDPNARPPFTTIVRELEPLSGSLWPSTWR